MAPMCRFNKTEETAAEILLYGDIGAGLWDGISAKEFAQELAGLGDVEEINLCINSPGGDVADGFAIYNTLNRHSARIIVDVDGLAASIASVIAMAGDEIRMAENASLMIHDPWTIAMGDAEELRRAASILDTLQGQIAGVYAARTGQSLAAIKRMMSAETWMTAEEARAAGFCTAVIDNKFAENRKPGKSLASGSWRRNLAARRLALMEREVASA
jgi:ATP-dependent Clp protease, protease subunit